MIGLDRTLLTSLLSEVSLSTWTELISLREGHRTAVIMSVPQKDVSRWIDASAEADLACVESSYALREVGVADSNHLLVRTSYEKGPYQDVILAKSIDLARDVANMSDDRERGRALGYPECCIESYVQRNGRAEWFETAIASTPVSSVLPLACNRLSALIDGRSFMPDYFPCSLACQATDQLGNKIIDSLKRLGFSQILDTAMAQLQRTIIVTPEICIRLPRPETDENADVLPRHRSAVGVVDRTEIIGNNIIVSWRDSFPLPSSSHQVLHILSFAPPAMEC